MGNTTGCFRDSSSDRQHQIEGQEVRDQSQRPEYRRPTHQDFAYNPPGHLQDRAEQPTQGSQERRPLRRIHRMQDLISPLAIEQFSRMMTEYNGRLTNHELEYEEQSDIREPEIIKSWSDQQVNDLHSKLDPTDKPASSNSKEEQNLLFIEEMDMRMIVYERQKGSLLDKYYSPVEDINREQDIKRMIQLHNQNREELVKTVLQYRIDKKDTLGAIPNLERKADLEKMIDGKIQEYSRSEK